MPRPAVGCIALAVAWAVVVAVGRGLALDDPAWYQALRKPAFQPPLWLYHVAWPLLLCLAAAAAVVAASALAADRRDRVRLAFLYLLNGVLNIGWAWLYFRCQRPDWAMLEWWGLLASVGGMIWAASRTSRAAAGLLAPYLAWILFAGAVNWSTVRLN